MSGSKKGKKSYKRVPKKVRAATTDAMAATMAPQAPAQPMLPDTTSGPDTLSQPDQQPTG